MAKLSNDALLDAFKEMTLLELSEFVKQFEDAFDVKAAAPVAVAGPAAAGADGDRHDHPAPGDVQHAGPAGVPVFVWPARRNLPGALGFALGGGLTCAGLSPSCSSRSRSSSS